MAKVMLFFLTMLCLAVSTWTIAQERDGVQVRREYHGAETPDHLVFAFHVGLIKSRESAGEHDLLIKIFQSRYKLASHDEAEDLLAKVVAAAASYEDEYGDTQKLLYCEANAKRNEADIYRKMDASDDARDAIAQKHYVLFLASLDEDMANTFAAWLEKEKEGFYHRAATHKSMYEDTGVDVTSRVDQICTSLAGK